MTVFSVSVIALPGWPCDSVTFGVLVFVVVERIQFTELFFRERIVRLDFRNVVAEVPACSSDCGTAYWVLFHEYLWYDNWHDTRSIWIINEFCGLCGLQEQTERFSPRQLEYSFGFGWSYACRSFSALCEFIAKLVLLSKNNWSYWRLESIF